MEDWMLDFEWLRVQHFVKEAVGRDTAPDMNAILLLVGIQELGRMQDKFSKEEKQDLMHIGVCRLLEEDGYYSFIGRDEDGWPHYNEDIPFSMTGVAEQSRYLKEKIIVYFKYLYDDESE